MRCYYRNTTFLPFAFFLHFRPNFIYNQLKEAAAKYFNKRNETMTRWLKAGKLVKM